MDPRIVKLACDIISASGPQRPADRALREILKRAGGLRRDDSRAVSRSVFAYFRWFGWLDQHRPLSGQLNDALDLAASFALRPDGFAETDLVARAVPAWVRDQMEVGASWVRTIQAEPNLWLRARRGQGRQLAGKLGIRRAGAPGWDTPDASDALLYDGDEDLFTTREFHAGEFEVQDIASQAVGMMCEPRPGETWWDACAGEGGKMLHLSDLMENKGLIWASDRATWRLRRLRLRAARARVFNFRVAVWSGDAKLPTRTKFDGVLVDAPCSGVGTWQRNPHARWTTTPEDVRELADVQKHLLVNAAPAVKPGGKLIYAACTLTRAETTEVTEWIRSAQPDYEPFPLNPAFGAGVGMIAPAPTISIWPQQCGGNGMFVAAWQRRP